MKIDEKKLRSSIVINKDWLVSIIINCYWKLFFLFLQFTLIKFLTNVRNELFYGVILLYCLRVGLL